MAKIDKKYHKLLKTILKNGKTYEDPNRKGIKRLQIPSYTFEYDLTQGFPAITTKKLYWKGVVGELLWFLRGENNIKYLVDNGCNIWNKDGLNYHKKKYPADVNLPMNEFIEQVKEGVSGDLGPVYGAQWRNWVGIDYDSKNVEFLGTKTDQISNLIKNLEEKPLATDHIVTAWNPAELDDMALPPCHNFFQINVWELTLEERDKLLPDFAPLEKSHELCDRMDIPRYGFELVWNQRSVDTFLGLPFNIASYALLAHILGKITNMVPMLLKGTLNNVHIYENSIQAVKEQLSRDINKYDKCELSMLDEFHYITDKRLVGNLPVDDILNTLRIDMFKLEDYQCYPEIKVEMLSRDI